MKNLIVLFFATLLVLTSVASIAQKTVSGVIADTETNEPLKGVTIGIVGQKKTVSTNKKGKFKIKAYSPEDTIYFTKQGYYSEVIQVGDIKKMKVGLTKISDKSTIITDAYGMQRSSRGTSAVTVLSQEAFNKGINNDIYQFLRGKVPGLTIRHDPTDPNSEPFIMLRSAGNLSGNIQPMILVDGVPNSSLSTLDPADVADVTVLRDGSAQAIYGSQATGGVILIKTRRK